MAGMSYLAKGPNILRSGTAKKKTAAHTIMITSCHGRPGLVWVILCPYVEFQYFKRITVTILLRCARNTCDDDIIAWVHRQQVMVMTVDTKKHIWNIWNRNRIIWNGSIFNPPAIKYGNVFSPLFISVFPLPSIPRGFPSHVSLEVKHPIQILMKSH